LTGWAILASAVRDVPVFWEIAVVSGLDGCGGTVGCCGGGCGAAVDGCGSACGAVCGGGCG
jgi:hypothetical protein